MSQEYEEMQVEKWVNLEDVAKHLSNPLSSAVFDGTVVECQILNFIFLNLIFF